MKSEIMSIADLKIGQLITFEINETNYVGYINVLNKRISGEGDVVVTYYKDEMSLFSIPNYVKFNDMKNIKIIKAK